MLQTGQLLGPYSLMERVGEGGMGEVWKALDTRLDRTIAIKALKRGFSDRLRSEARAISALNHPHICTLYDIGSENGVDFLVLEYVTGRPLQGPLPVDSALRYAIQIADALDAAHREGIIHRDLKPSNILITKSGVKLLDFGVAKMRAAHAAADSTVSVSTSMDIAGTPQYMAPEQLESGVADQRTDVWAFGCVLYEMLTGRYAFERPGAVFAPEAGADIPPSIARLIHACLTKEPEDRFQTARDLKRCLEWTAAPVEQEPVAGRSERVTTPCIRPLTMSGGIVEHPSFSPDGKQVVFSWNGPRSETPNLYLKLIDVEDILRLTNGAAPDLAPAWSREGSRIAFLRDLDNGRAALMTISPLGGNHRKIADISISLEPVGASLTWTPDGKYLITSERLSGSPRSPYGLVLISATDGKKVRLTEISAEEPGDFVLRDGFAAISPKGDKLAFIRVTGTAQSRLVWMPLGPDYRSVSTPRTVETGFVTHMSARWTNDGGSLLLAAGTGAAGHLYISTLNCNGVPEPVTPALQITAAELHAATGRVICQSPAQTINIWELPLRDGKPAGDPISLTCSTHLNVRPVYSPDGNWIAFTSTRTGDVGVWIMDRSGSRITRLPAPESGVSVVTDWSPDSKSVYLFSNPRNQYDIFSIELESGSIRQITQHPSNDWRARCSRDGNWLYFTSSRQGKFLLWRIPITGEPATPVTTRPASSAQESPDGRWLYYAAYPAGGLYRTPLSGGAEEQILSNILDTESYAVAPNGIFYLARAPGAHERRYSLGVPFARADLHFLNTETGQDERLLHFPRPLYGGLSLAPDGRSLAYAEMERDTQELVLIEDLFAS